MTDKNKYRNVSLKHLSIAATIESTVQEAVEKLNGKLSGKN